MKKSTFLFLVTAFILLNHSCREDVILNEADYYLKSSLTKEKEIIEEAWAWYENIPLENQFSLLEAADKLKWEKAVVNYVDIGLVVEIPIIIKDSRKLKIKNNDAINIEQRLLIIDNGGQKYALIEFFISSGNNESFYNIKN